MRLRINGQGKGAFQGSTASPKSLALSRQALLEHPPTPVVSRLHELLVKLLLEPRSRVKETVLPVEHDAYSEVVCFSGSHISPRQPRKTSLGASAVSRPQAEHVNPGFLRFGLHL